MKRELLEQRITEAVDGYLSARQQKDLEAELASHPDLKSAYDELMTDTKLDDLNFAFPESRPDLNRLIELRSHIENPFYSTAYVMFKRYFLAATIVVTIFTTGMHLLTEREAGLADDHIYEWIYDNNLDALDEESEIWLISDLEE